MGKCGNRVLTSVLAVASAAGLAWGVGGNAQKVASAASPSPAFPKIASIYSKTDENSDAGKRNIARFQLYVSDMTWWGLLCGADYNCQGHASMTTGQYFKYLNPGQTDLMYQHSVFTEGWSAPSDGRGYTVNGKPYYIDLRWLLTYAGSALSAPVDALATSIPVLSSSPFHVGDNVLLGGVGTQNVELAKVAAVNANTLTVARAQFDENGKFPAAIHAQGDYVRPVVHAFGYQDFMGLNMTSYCPTSDVNPAFGSQTWNQFQASFWAAKIASEPAYNNLDGLFLDNVVSSPGSILDNAGAVDYTGSNSPTDTSQGANLFADGMSDNAARMQVALGPGKVLEANTGGDAANNGAYLNGGMIEGVDKTGSNTFVGGASTFYNSWQDSGRTPTSFIYEGSDVQTNYQAMRYLLAGALQRDGYFAYDEYLVNGGHQTEWWYDEYDNAGQGAGYLGQPLESPTQPLAGVFRRDFGNGIVLRNTTASTVTVDLGGTFQKIKGVQDSKTNDGSLVTAVTVPSMDGVILLRTSVTLTATPSGISALTPTATASVTPSNTAVPSATATATSVPNTATPTPVQSTPTATPAPHNRGKGKG
jgi:hypothetical protein